MHFADGPLTDVVFGLAGLGIGILGTLIGAGGGFLVVPLLVFAEPTWSTDQVTAFSLAIVTANATAGALSYWWQGRVDPFTFPLYTVAAVPGSIVGAYATAYLPRPVFDPIFGGALVVIGIWLLWKPGSSDAGTRTGPFERRLVDRDGHHYRWSFHPWIGFVGSILIGALSSVLGIGGGIIHVPLLATVLGFPAHVATATSHAVLAVTAGIATIVHLIKGDYRTTWPLVLISAGGAVLGAPLGARLSRVIPGATILRVLAVGLGFVGVRLLIVH
jgi:uncharacterized membrane protein YfcA